MKYLLSIFLFLSATVAFSQTVPKERYDELKESYSQLKEENKALKAQLNKPSKWSVGYKVGYVPDSNELALNNFSHNIEIGYDLSGLRMVAGITYDWQIANSSAYVGSEMMLITKGKASWLAIGALGTNVGSDKTAFVNYGFGINYALSKKVALSSQIKWNYFESQVPSVLMNVGVNYHF